MILMVIGTEFPGAEKFGMVVTLMDTIVRQGDELLLCLPWGISDDLYLQADNENHVGGAS